MSDGSKVRVFEKNISVAKSLGDDSSFELRVDELRDNLETFMGSLQTILPALATSPGGLELKTVTVAVGINGKAQVGFLGTGAEVGGNATLTLTLSI